MIDQTKLIKITYIGCRKKLISGKIKLISFSSLLATFYYISQRIKINAKKICCCIIKYMASGLCSLTNEYENWNQ